MKKIPAGLVHLDASMLATDVSLAICGVKKQREDMQRFNLWFEQKLIKAYIRYGYAVDANKQPCTAICLANVSVVDSARHLGGLTKLLEELENKAYLHRCKFYVESVITNWVMHTCSKRGYTAVEQDTSGIFNYWFNGHSTMEMTPPDLFTEQESEAAFRS